MTLTLSDRPLAVNTRFPSGVTAMPQGRRPMFSVIVSMTSWSGTEMTYTAFVPPPATQMRSPSGETAISTGRLSSPRLMVSTTSSVSVSMTLTVPPISADT